MGSESENTKVTQNKEQEEVFAVVVVVVVVSSNANVREGANNSSATD
jgi:hypothetical protein